MKLASIQIITHIRPIDGADRIEAARVIGYQTVIKKGEFRPGDRCVWHEPDTIAAEKPEYEFLRKQGFRLKVSRFKGQVSQGLALPVTILPSAEYELGADVTELTGIRKYEKPLSRNLELLDDPSSMFWRVAREHRLREALATLNGDFMLQGEVHGEGIQGNHLGVKGVTLVAFNLFDIAGHAYAGHKALGAFCRATGLPVVREVWQGEFRFTLPELVELANAQDYAPGRPAEGIVIRTVEEARSMILESGRLSAKVISERYALKHGE